MMFLIPHTVLYLHKCNSGLNILFVESSTCSNSCYCLIWLQTLSRLSVHPHCRNCRNVLISFIKMVCDCLYRTKTAVTAGV